MTHAAVVSFSDVRITSPSLRTQCARRARCTGMATPQRETAPVVRPVITVNDILARLASHVTAFGCAGLTVRGRIASRKYWRSQHLYFDLVGSTDDIRVSCAIFNAIEAEVVEVSDGTQVLVQFERASFRKGRLQVMARSVVPAVEAEGAGTEEPRHLAVAKLSQMGLLDRPKRAVPEVVQHMCLVTSVGSAAYHDMMRSVAERWPGMRITIVDTLVQGTLASASIVAAMRLARAQSPDVIVCARGGGSACDLAVFDTVPVAREMCGSWCAVVSAIGHETDTTACDLVADVRAKTPTAAIELLIPVTREERIATLRSERCTLESTVCHRLRLMQEEIRWCVQFAQNSMRVLLVHLEATFHQTTAFLRDHVCNYLKKTERGLKTHCARLHALASTVLTLGEKTTSAASRELHHSAEGFLNGEASQLECLQRDLVHGCPVARGGAMVTSGKRRISAAADVSVGDQICITYADGTIVASIAECRRHASRMRKT